MKNQTSTPPRRIRGSMESRVRRIVRLGERIGTLAEKKRAILDSLPMQEVIEFGGEKFQVVKPAGRFVFNVDRDLKRLPKNPRKPAKSVAEKKA